MTATKNKFCSSVRPQKMRGYPIALITWLLPRSHVKKLKIIQEKAEFCGLLETMHFSVHVTKLQNPFLGIVEM